MPSRYEPCGLNQLYSQRYGTLPIVRAVGGLDDLIVEYDPVTGRGNGFKFIRYDAAELLNKIKAAISSIFSRSTGSVSSEMPCPQTILAKVGRGLSSSLSDGIGEEAALAFSRGRRDACFSLKGAIWKNGNRIF